MALICGTESYLAVAASANVFIAERKSDGDRCSSRSDDDDSKVFVLPALIDDTPSEVEESDEPTTNEANGKQSADSGAPTSPQILAIGFSSSGRLLAICNNRKQLIVWKSVEGEWKEMKHWSLEKQATSLTFAGAEDKLILVADRSGQVLEYDLDSSEPAGKVLLGHLSILLDLCLSKDQRYLLTADRDEKIRVSHYPKAYNIEAFCLGHTEYVRALCLCPRLHETDHDALLASGGGDGFLKLWRFIDGTQLASFDLGGAQSLDASSNDSKPEPRRIRKILCVHRSESTFRLAILFEGASNITFLDIHYSSGTGYTLSQSTEWTPGHSSSIADAFSWESRIDVLLTSESGFSLSHIDASTFPPVQTPVSSMVKALIGCKELEQCMAKSKEELPPMVKVVQFDNVGEYLERKKARVEGKAK